MNHTTMNPTTSNIAVPEYRSMKLDRDGSNIATLIPTETHGVRPMNAVPFVTSTTGGCHRKSTNDTETLSKTNQERDGIHDDIAMSSTSTIPHIESITSATSDRRGNNDTGSIRSAKNDIDIDGTRQPTFKKLSHYHPIPRNTTTTIKFPKAKFHTLLQRLQTMFYQESIHVVRCGPRINDNNESNNMTYTIHCYTMDRIRFDIMFWEYSVKYLLLDVQQLSGDRINFYKHYMKCIQSAFRGDRFVKRCTKDSIDNHTNPQQQQLPSSKTIQLLPARSLLSSSGNNLIKTDQDEIILSALEIASDCLRCDRYDARLLGLQSFHNMLRPSSTMIGTDNLQFDGITMDANYHHDQDVIGKMIARGILLGDNVIDILNNKYDTERDNSNNDSRPSNSVDCSLPWETIHRRICYLALTGKFWHEDEDMYDEHSVHGEEKNILQPHLDIRDDCHTEAMTIVSKSIALLTLHEKELFVHKMDQLLASVSPPSSSSLFIHLIMDYISSYTDHPHMANLAAKTLMYILPIIIDQSIPNGTNPKMMSLDSYETSHWTQIYEWSQLHHAQLHFHITKLLLRMTS
jgi:hypothetical protein